MKIRFSTIASAVALLLASVTVQAGDDIDRELALAVAKVCANEASIARARPADCAMIWQITEARKETNSERLEWLKAHSSCVLGDNPPASRLAIGNCRWTRTLTWSDERPSGWRDTDGDWSRIAPRWSQMRTLSLRLVRGQETMRPCARPPATWGGRMDRARAERLGFIRVRCVGTHNDGYVYPPRRR